MEQAQPRPQIVAKQPISYKYGTTDFVAWYRQFTNYCVAVGTEERHKYVLFLSFLDTKSFTIVENLGIEQNDKLNMQLCYERIKIALQAQDSQIPARYALKYRKQKSDETLDDFCYELEQLAVRAFPRDQGIQANQTLIESFISGLRNDQLSIKLLQEQYDTLAAALTAAKTYLSAYDTRKFLKEGHAQSQKSVVFNTDVQEIDNDINFQVAAFDKLSIDKPKVGKKLEQPLGGEQSNPFLPKVNNPLQPIHAESYLGNEGRIQNANPYPGQSLNNFGGNATWGNGGQLYPAYSDNIPRQQYPSYMTPNTFMGQSQQYPRHVTPDAPMEQAQTLYPQQPYQFPQGNSYFSGRGYNQNWQDINRGYPQPGTYRPQKSRNSVVCYFCNKKGHYRANCYAYQRYLSQGASKNGFRPN